MGLETTGVPYAMINESNLVYDLVSWDGNTSTWQPPTGVTCVAIGTDKVAIGMTYNSSGVGFGTTSANKWISSSE
tara:strand:- start:411 stop:635 length:225 start_codon:yes stop_codon:yes gene_type:complete